MASHNGTKHLASMEVSVEAGNAGAAEWLDDDGRPGRTGTFWTASAHMVTAVIDSGVLSNHPVQVEYSISHADVPGHRDQHRHLLDAARALMLLGAVFAVTATGNHDTDATQVIFLGFVTWLLGVCLCLLSFHASGRSVRPTS